MPPPTPAASIRPPTSVPDGPRDRLLSADGTLAVGVGSYTDCSGRSEVPRAVAALDPCFLGRFYFVGHNPGVFTPLMHMVPGDQITYYDSSGRPQVFRIVAVRTAGRSAFTPPISPEVVAQFQTCAVADGSIDRLLDAVRQ